MSAEDVSLATWGSKKLFSIDNTSDYLPWYMVMFLRQTQPQKSLIYEIDISGLNE